MCPPVLFAASLLISGLGAAAEYGAKQQQYAAERDRYAQNATNAYAAQRDEQRSLTLRQMQEQDAKAQKSHMVNVEAAEKKAEVQVSAAGANVAGLSVGNLIADVGRRASNQQLSLQRNWEMTAQQLQAEQDATVNRAQSRINQVAVPYEPSAAGAVIGFAGSGIKAYGNYMM